MTRNQLRLLFCGALLLLLAGCGGAGTNYYRLDATAPATGNASAAGLSVSVGPVSLPTYLERPEVVFATGPNEFQVPSDALWIGSLRDNISRTVAADLGRLLGSANVRGGSEPRSQPRFRVALDIRRFHGISGQGAILDLSWTIRSGGGQMISRQSAVFHEQIVGDGYGPLVVAESRLLEQCAAAIAQSLR